MKKIIEDLKIKVVDVLKELLVCLKLVANPKSWWIFLPFILAVISVYVADSNDIAGYLVKGTQETAALILMGTTITVLAIAAIKFRNIASLFFLVLAINFLIRELDSTMMDLPFLGTIKFKSKGYINVAMGLMAAWGLWQERKMIAFFYDYSFVKIIFIGVFSSYFSSQLIARRVFKYIKILPNEAQHHVLMEEITENAAHIFFLAFALLVLWHAFRTRKKAIDE